MKKERKAEKNFSTLLVKNYLIFTLAVFAVILGIYFAASTLMDRMMPIIQTDRLIDKLAQADEKSIKSLRLDFYLNTGSHFVLLDEKGKTIYADESTLKKDFSEQQLEFMTDYNADSLLSVSEFPSENGEKRYLLEEEVVSEDSIRKIGGYLLLDENYEILSGNLFPDRTFFTKQEFEYLSGMSGEDMIIRKYGYENKNGEKRTAVLYLREVSEAQYLRALQLWDKCWLAFIPAYLVIVMTCIRSITKKTRGFLLPLNKAIVNFFHNGAKALQNYKGPKEFMVIAENFNSLAEQLETSEAERLRLDEGRQKLLADISHDLKTPITVIRGYSGALADGVVPPEDQKKYLETICKKADRMAELLDMFHEYSTINHPDLPVQITRVDLCDAAQVYFAEKYEELEVSGFTLEAEIPAEPIFCMLDLRLWKRALDNLINNALKYNQSGTNLFFRLSTLGKKAQMIVGDNGCGIPQELAANLFEPFVTGDQSRSGKHGSGLGLAISQKIIRAHGGEIRLVMPPEPPLATEFQILLPLVGEEPRKEPKK